MKSLILCLTFVLSGTFANAADQTFKATVDYQLAQANDSIPVQFFTALNINEFVATLVDDKTGELSHCYNSKRIMAIYQIDNVVSFNIELTGSGPCQFPFNDQAGFIKKLTEDLKDYPVFVR